MSEKQSIPQYVALGHALLKARQAAGIETQQGLAELLGVKQQSVSRWEAGTHRPRANQLPAIAAALQLNTADLRRLVGDEDMPAQGPLSPFPLDRVAPETFEEFVADLIQLLYPNAVVRRAGSSGHKQGGIDVAVDFPDGRFIGVQCKRERRFGPSDFAEAAKAAENVGGEKILTLSRTASPQTAAAVQAAPNWSIWDKDDISRLIRRRLSYDDQTRLVDVYFPGQRTALLGRDEPGPWRTRDEFFRPFSATDSLLSHAWPLLGRGEELDSLHDALRRPNTPLIFLTGPGGFGKSRLLKAVVDRIGADEPCTRVRFLASTDIPSRRTLEDLGPGPKILVIDDAHDREALGLLYEFVIEPRNQTRLLVAARPYATARLRRDAAALNIDEPPEISLKPLRHEDLIRLATTILEKFDAPTEWASHVVAASYGSPMVVAMGARVVAKEQTPLELAKSQSAVRNLILQKFSKMITGELGGRGEEGLYRATLELLALVQPFHPEDMQLVNIIASVKKTTPDEVARVLKRLVEGGVIYRRGAQWRLMPDVLGDYLIEESCLDSSGNLSIFARGVLEIVPQSMLKQVMENLVRMDWRRSNGDTSDSILLTDIWHRLSSVDTDWDPRIEAVKAMALYQPRQALDFVANQIRKGQKYSALSEILRNIAFTSTYFDDVLEMLWALGRADGRDAGPYPAHPIRTLVELGEYGEHRSVEFSRKLLEFGLKLADNETSWDSPYTPVDILKPLLATEGVTTESTNTKISMTPFLVNYEVVKPLREAVITKSLELVCHPQPKIACAAVKLVQQALHSPLGYMGNSVPEEIYRLYENEFVETLHRVRKLVTEGLHSITTIIVARSVKWLAQHSSSVSGEVARDIIRLLPQDVAFQTRRALIDSHGETFVDHEDIERGIKERDAWLVNLAWSIRAQIPDPIERLALIESALTDIFESGESNNSEYALLHTLFRDEAFALAVVKNASTRGSSPIRSYIGIALNNLLRTNRPAGHQIIGDLLLANESVLSRAVAQGYAGLGDSINSSDQDIMRGILRSNDLTVVESGIRTVTTWGTAQLSVMLDLLLESNIQTSARLANEIAMALSGINKRPLELVTKSHAVRLLNQLMPISKFDGYWIDELLADLSMRFPNEAANFLMERVERASREQSYELMPVNPKLRGHKHLRFLESDQAKEVLEMTWAWLLGNQGRDHYFKYASQNLFEAMFLYDEGTTVEFLRPRLESATSQELVLISDMLRNANHNFVFVQSDFIARFLERCQAVDVAIMEDATHSLYASAISGMRSGMPGEPMPRDLNDRDLSEKILTQLPRVSAAFRLYDLIRKSAVENIKRSLQERNDEVEI